MAAAHAKTNRGNLTKVAIVGPESSGKTFLAEKLAQHYKCLWVPEYAREYLMHQNHPYTKEDVEKIAKGQIQWEDVAAKRSKSLLICDTNLLVIKIWMEHKYGNAPQWIEKEISQRKYRLHLLTAPDVPYENDPLRENPELGKYFFEKYKSLLEELDLTYEIISGNKERRLIKALSSIEDLNRQSSI